MIEFLFNVFIYGFGGLMILFFAYLALSNLLAWWEDKMNMMHLMYGVVGGFVTIIVACLYFWLFF